MARVLPRSENWRKRVSLTEWKCRNKRRIWRISLHQRLPCRRQWYYGCR